MPESEGAPAQSVPDYIALVRLIRDEMDAAVRPLRDDIRELKQESYTREMIDAMFKLRDERIARFAQIGTWIVGASTVLYSVLVALQVMGVIK